MTENGQEFDQRILNSRRERFGMHYVDFEDPDRVRTPKESSKFYAQIVADNGFVEGCCSAER